MEKSDKSLAFAAANPKEFGSLSSVDVPRYALYGDESVALQEMINLEPLDKRCRERGWVVAPHTHPRFTQIIIVTQGGGDLTLESDVAAFAAPCALVIPPFRIHGLRYAENSNGWVLTIQTPYLNDLLVRAPELSGLLSSPRVIALRAPGFGNIPATVRALEAELNGDAAGRTVATEIHTLGLFLALLRALPPGLPGYSHASAQAEPIDRLRSFIEAHYREQPSVSDFARELGMSTARLRSICKIETGLSPLEMLHDRIMFEARRMLVYTAKNISEVGAELGFGDPAYFNRFFLRFTQKTPRQYRILRQYVGVSKSVSASAEKDAGHDSAARKERRR